MPDTFLWIPSIFKRPHFMKSTAISRCLHYRTIPAQAPDTITQKSCNAAEVGAALCVPFALWSDLQHGGLGDMGGNAARGMDGLEAEK